MIRQTVLRDIQSTISEHDRFELSEFKFETKSGYSEQILTISYLGNTDYYFKADFPVSTEGAKPYQITGECSPGRISFKEDYSTTSVSGLCGRIKGWLNGVWEELQQIPLVRRQEEQKKRLDDLWSQFDTTSKEFFTHDQAENIKGRLDELEKTLSDSLEELIEDAKELKKERDSIKKDIETLKSTIESMNKGFWSKSFFAKVMRWGAKSENRKMLEAGYDFAKGIVTESKLLE